MAKKKIDPGIERVHEDGAVQTLDVVKYNENVPENYVPEGFKTAEDYLKHVRETYQFDLDADYENRTEALSDKKFVAGDQWDPQVLQHRQGLPCLVINTIPQFTAQLVGDWRQSRNAVKVLPNTDGEEDVAQIRGDLIRAIEMRSRADRVYDNAFESAVQCGDGAFRIAVEYARDDVFDQDIFVRPIDDALSVVWDRMSLDPTGKDARHCFVEDRIPKEEFERRWPGVDPWTLGNMNRDQHVLLRTTGWYDDHSAKIVEHWRMIERNRLIGLFEDGSIHVVEGHTVEDLMKAHGKMVKSRVSPCLYAQMHLVSGWKILGGPFEWKLSRLPIIRMTGRTVNIAGERVRFGLVRFMKDSARLRNFWRSVAAEQLGYAPKSQWIAPESAVVGREDAFRKAHLTRDPLLIYNDDAQAPPERIEPPAPQIALMKESEVNTQDMKDVTGIHDASLGINGNETSGRAIMARQREGDTASITYYDNGNAAILEGGDVINQLISQIYDGTRIILTVGEDEAVRFIRVNDPADPSSPNLAIPNYQVALTSGVSYTTRREAAAEAMMNAVQVWPQLMSVAGDLVAKAQDWPGADKLAERLQKTIPPQFLDPEDQEKSQANGQFITPEMMQQVQQQLQQMQAEYEKTKQENLHLKTRYEVDMTKNAVDQYEAETRRLKVVGDLHGTHDKNMIDIVKHGTSMAHEATSQAADQQHAQDILDAQQQFQKEQETQLRNTLTSERIQSAAKKNNPSGGSSAGSPSG